MNEKAILTKHAIFICVVYTDHWTLMHTKIMCVVFNSYLDTVAWLKSAFSVKTTEA